LFSDEDEEKKSHGHIRYLRERRRESGRLETEGHITDRGTSGAVRQTGPSTGGERYPTCKRNEFPFQDCTFSTVIRDRFNS